MTPPEGIDCRGRKTRDKDMIPSRNSADLNQRNGTGNGKKGKTLVGHRIDGVVICGMLGVKEQEDLHFGELVMSLRNLGKGEEVKFMREIIHSI